MKFKCGAAQFACVDVKQAKAYATRIGASGTLMTEFDGELIDVDELEAAKAAKEASAAVVVEPPVPPVPPVVPPTPVVPPVTAVVPPAPVLPEDDGTDASGNLGDPAEEDN